MRSLWLQNSFQFIFYRLWIASLGWDSWGFAGHKLLWSVMMARSERRFLRERKRRKRCPEVFVGRCWSSDVGSNCSECLLCTPRHLVSSLWLFLFYHSYLQCTLLIQWLIHYKGNYLYVDLLVCYGSMNMFAQLIMRHFSCLYKILFIPGILFIQDILSLLDTKIFFMRNFSCNNISFYLVISQIVLIISQNQHISLNKLSCPSVCIDLGAYPGCTQRMGIIFKLVCAVFSSSRCRLDVT